MCINLLSCKSSLSASPTTSFIMLNVIILKVQMVMYEVASAAFGSFNTCGMKRTFSAYANSLVKDVKRLSLQLFDLNCQITATSVWCHG